MHLAAWAILALGTMPGSSAEIVREVDLPGEKAAEVAVEARAGKKLIPVRVIITASDGTHPDGSGNGAYGDGRFFAEGSFAVKLPSGMTRLQIWSGPNHAPLDFRFEAKAGKKTHVAAALHPWFSPEDRGWYAGDNHVHAQHDAVAAVKTSLSYTALQARANGLSYVTEAGSELGYEGLNRLDTPTFLFRYAPEVRIGPFIGHRNTPGIAQPIAKDRLDPIFAEALPTESLVREVHAREGAVIYTHPLTPPHQLHWMGSPEAWSNGVRGRCADAFDVDSGATELFWFALLNLGNRVAVSGSTDAALGRLQTPSPGDRRVYCKASEFKYESIVVALRRGETFATNGGPLFPFFTLEGKGPGSVLELENAAEVVARGEVHSLYPIRKAMLIADGKAVHTFEMAGKIGETTLTHTLRGDAASAGWYVLRVEDERGNWGITSPVYVTSKKRAEHPFACVLMAEISNHTRFIELRKDYYAHMVVTVSPGESIEEMELLRDGKPMKSFRPQDGNQRANGKTPVTAINGEYGPGWLWARHDQAAMHVQADWPVRESGWYEIRCRTKSGKTLVSDSMYFDADHAKSQALSILNATGPKTRWSQWGYGEEMPVKDIQTPFKGDHWWYPQNTFWRVRAELGGGPPEVKGGGMAGAESKFRKARPDG